MKKVLKIKNQSQRMTKRCNESVNTLANLIKLTFKKEGKRESAKINE